MKKPKSVDDGYSEPVWLDIDEIDIRPASEMRAAVSDEVIEAYAESFDALPPVRVMADGAGVHWLVDGSYRIRAARKLGRDKVRCRYKTGTYLEAFAEAALANDAHGVRATNADKRRRVEVALSHPQISRWANRRIAEFCGVSHRFVHKLRPEVDTVSTSRVGKDGKTYPSQRQAPGNGQPKPTVNGRPAQAAPEPKAEAPHQPSTAGNSSAPAKAQPRPQAALDVDEFDGEPEEEVLEYEAHFRAVEPDLRRRFGALPEDQRPQFAGRLISLGNELTSLCSGVVDRSQEIFV